MRHMPGGAGCARRLRLRSRWLVSLAGPELQVLLGGGLGGGRWLAGIRSSWLVDLARLSRPVPLDVDGLVRGQCPCLRKIGYVQAEMPYQSFGVGGKNCLMFCTTFLYHKRLRIILVRLLRE